MPTAMNARLSELLKPYYMCPEHGIKLVTVSEKKVPLKRRKGLYEKIITMKCPKCDYAVKIFMLVSESGEKDGED